MERAIAKDTDFAEPQGFLSVAKNVGIKDQTLDLTVIYSTVRARAAAMFTRNIFPGAPVIIGSECPIAMRPGGAALPIRPEQRLERSGPLR